MSVSVYGSLTDTSSQVNILADAFINSDFYNPFVDYFIVRSSQYSYTLYVLDEEHHTIIYFSSASPGSEYHLSFGSASDVSINTSFTYVGNVPGSLACSQLNTAKFEYCSFLLLVYYLFELLQSHQ